MLPQVESIQRSVGYINDLFSALKRAFMPTSTCEKEMIQRHGYNGTLTTNLQRQFVASADLQLIYLYTHTPIHMHALRSNLNEYTARVGLTKSLALGVHVFVYIYMYVYMNNISL